MICMPTKTCVLTGTLTPGWNRLKPGLRYDALRRRSAGAVRTGRPRVPDRAPALDSKENVKWSYLIKGAAGSASRQQVGKFTKALEQMKKSGVAGMKLGGLRRHQHDRRLQGGEHRLGGRHDPMMEARVSERRRAGMPPHRQRHRRCRPKPCGSCIRVSPKPGDGAHHAVSLQHPGMEDVEDVIVVGTNTWPNWRNFSDRIISLATSSSWIAALTWNGYKSCYYRTYCVGKEPSQEQKDVYATALKWLYDSIGAVKAGATTREIASKWPSAQEAYGTRKRTRPRRACGAMASASRSISAGHLAHLVARSPDRDQAGHGVRARNPARQDVPLGRSHRRC
jgi:hypothetical protein